MQTIWKMANAGWLIGAVVGGVLVVLGGIMFPVIDKIVHDEVVKNVILYKNTSVGYQNWADLPGGLYIDFYFFTLVNKAEVMTGAKPAFVEMGPYSYKQFKPKGNITYNHEKGTVNYTSTPTYVFDPETSVGDPQDKITTINVPMVAVVEEMKYLSPTLQKIVLGFLKFESEELFIERTVQDILWGYEDPVLKLIHRVKPDLVPDPHFGFMYNRNNTVGNPYEVYSGETDVMQIGNIAAYRGLDHLEWWTTPEANAINGSDGTFNHPFWSKHGEAYLFSSDACRSVIMKFEKDTEIHGIPTWKFSIPEYALKNGISYSPNAGFCLPDIHHCLPDGLLNISQCQGGAPAIMSLPHFLYCDKEKVQDLVYGLNPDPEKHDAYINVEPYTGASLEGALRMQFNIWMEKSSEVEQMKNIPTLAFPVMWVNQIGTVSAEAAGTIKNKLVTPIFITNIVKWSAIAVGAAMFIIFISVGITVYFKRKSTVKRLSNSNFSTAGSVNSSNGVTSVPPLNETEPLLS